MESGRKKGIEWEHVLKIEDSVRISCNYCHELISKKMERIRAHLKDCQKKKEYLEKKLSSRNSDISVLSSLNISDVSVPMTSPKLIIG